MPTEYVSSEKQTHKRYLLDELRENRIEKNAEKAERNCLGGDTSSNWGPFYKTQPLMRDGMGPILENKIRKEGFGRRAETLFNAGRESFPSGHSFVGHTGEKETCPSKRKAI